MTPTSVVSTASANRSSSLRSYTTPVGLHGLLIITSFVRGVTARLKLDQGEVRFDFES